MTVRPKRPSDEDYARALALYRANASPEQIADRVGLTLEQVEHAQLEGWPPRHGKHPLPALRAWEHEIDDRIHRARLAALDWAQAVSEASALHAKDWASTVRKASGIKQSILSAWGASVKREIDRAAREGKVPSPADLSIPIDSVRSLRALQALMDPAQQAKLADVYRFLRGSEDEDDGEGELEKIQAALADLSPEQLSQWEETGVMPEQKVLPFPSTGSG